MTSQNLIWARVWPTTNHNTAHDLRRGAWYPVDEMSSSWAKLIVRGHSVTTARRLVEIREDAPSKFTVVYRVSSHANPVAGTNEDLGRTYAVCPRSGSRIRLYGEPPQLTCPECGYKGPVAWWET